MTRGILATAYLRPLPGVDRRAASRRCTRTSAPPARSSTSPPTPPATKSVTGTNRAAIHVGWQDGVAVVTVAIDNLGKGGAGQAVHALNVRFGFDETAGLESRVLWP